jgi:hypothetical protein
MLKIPEFDATIHQEKLFDGDLYLGIGYAKKSILEAFK